VREARVAGAEDPVFPEIDIDLGEDAEPLRSRSKQAFGD
jgi:hypothetical protein